MALTLLDGTNANLDFTIATVSYKCQVNSMAMEFSRQLFTRITFCSTNWLTNNNGMKSARFMLTGYPGKGTAGSKPGQFFTSDSYPAIVATFDTGCTVGFTAAISSETLGAVAASNGSFTLGGENKNDDLAVTWVTS
jgi:hypothetical protein